MIFFLFSTGSMYYSCSSASEQTRFHMHGIEKGFAAWQICKIRIRSKFRRFGHANINVWPISLGVDVGRIEEKTVLFQSLSRA